MPSHQALGVQRFFHHFPLPIGTKYGFDFWIQSNPDSRSERSDSHNHPMSDL